MRPGVLSKFGLGLEPLGSIPAVRMQAPVTLATSKPEIQEIQCDGCLCVRAGRQCARVTVPSGQVCELGVPSGALQQLSLIHISEPTRLLSISYAVFCLKKKKKKTLNILKKRKTSIGIIPIK
eukprot:TRINITY_DN50090_c0_g1_i1.p2 TRINITY_DN50090_c0_g1~~TRINITY_DN50090_c0_g1_i1.p2  ORF type:complete len:123 (+),score=15.55 TRINITY_DN50090_c0_g1_i1:595-963(+)